MAGPGGKGYYVGSGAKMQNEGASTCGGGTKMQNMNRCENAE